MFHPYTKDYKPSYIAYVSLDILTLNISLYFD